MFLDFVILLLPPIVVLLLLCGRSRDGISKSCCCLLSLGKASLGLGKAGLGRRKPMAQKLADIFYLMKNRPPSRILPFACFMFSSEFGL